MVMNITNIIYQIDKNIQFGCNLGTFFQLKIEKKILLQL